MRKSLQVAASVGTLALVLSACSSSSKSVSGGGASTSGTSGKCSWAPGVQYYGGENNSGTPKTGGTLTALGVADVDEALDLNIGYLTYDYSMYDLYSRSLYTYPSVHCQQITPEPDLATGPPVVTDNGLHVAVTIRQGAMWDTNPPRQVTAADEILGLKRACNPTDPFGGTGDFSDVIAGYTTFCNGFANVSTTSASAQAAYIDSHQISGVQVDPGNPRTVDFTLLKPAAYLEGVMTLPPFNPAPQEILQAVTDSANVWQYVESDGPYKIQSYDPGKSITFVRNPDWNASSDPIRKAYVDQIDISETGTAAGIYQQVITNSPQADIEWDTAVPPNDIPGLISSKDPRFTMVSSAGPNYIVWNTASPNNNKALANPVVRQALDYAVNPALIEQDAGGPTIAPPITHVLAAPTVGSTPNYDDYPYDPTKAKQLLASAGVSNLTLKFLYYPQSVTLSKNVQTLQANLAQVGVKVVPVPVNQTDFYAKYLYKPNEAQSGYWDFAIAGWTPDWFSDAAKSYFVPLFTGQTPNTSNFGLFNDPKLSTLIDQALSAPTDSAAAPIWHQADEEVMSQAAWDPLYIQNYVKIQGSQVHNCVVSPQLETCDFANVWLSS
jgi:peptide/nickel transport system substrate-binding protein